MDREDAICVVALERLPHESGSLGQRGWKEGLEWCGSDAGEMGLVGDCRGRDGTSVGVWSRGHQVVWVRWTGGAGECRGNRGSTRRAERERREPDGGKGRSAARRDVGRIRGRAAAVNRARGARYASLGGHLVFSWRATTSWSYEWRQGLAKISCSSVPPQQHTRSWTVCGLRAPYHVVSKCRRRAGMRR